MNAKPETIADRLRAARAARGVSQSALAKALKLTRGAVGQWEMGVTEPSRENLRDAAAFLRVSKNWLETGEGNGPGAAPLPLGRGEGDQRAVLIDTNVAAATAEAWVVPDAFIREAARGPVTRLLSVPSVGADGEPAFVEVSIVGRLVHGRRS